MIGPIDSDYRSVPVNAHLSGVKACVFDAYGTLFDVNSTIRSFGNRVQAALVNQLSVLWRQKQLQYTWLRTIQGTPADFWQITGDALDFALGVMGITTPALRDQLLAQYLSLEVFPEVPEMLRRIRSAGLNTVILSNGTPNMIGSAVKNAGLGSMIDLVLSVDEVGVYKPHPKVYGLAVERLHVAASAIAFQSANAWDAHGAAAFGMQVVWCNRDGQPQERLPGAPHIEVTSLADLPELLGA